MKKRVSAGVLGGTLAVAQLSGSALAGGPQVQADLTCDGTTISVSGDASDIRGWANRTYAGYRKTCESGSIQIWVGWTSTEAKNSRSF